MLKLLASFCNHCCMHKQIKGSVLPGYPVYEYLLVLLPHEDLRKKIHAVQAAFCEKYKVEARNSGRSHLTLALFTQYDMLADRMVSHLKNIAMGFCPFAIDLKDYGSLPSHSIFINVGTELQVQALVKQVRTDGQRLMKLNNEHKPLFLTEPVISLARRLQPWQYEQGWLEMSHRHFTGRFIADGMLLMKRRYGDFNYEVIQRFVFENLPLLTKQGNLFA